MLSLSHVNNVNNVTSILQAIPVIGPAVISPVKSVISIVQLISGVAQAILFGTLTIGAFALHKQVKAYQYLGKVGESLKIAGEAIRSIAYSVLNMASLGVVGLICERNKSQGSRAQQRQQQYQPYTYNELS